MLHRKGKAEAAIAIQLGGAWVSKGSCITGYAVRMEAYFGKLCAIRRHKRSPHKHNYMVHADAAVHCV